MVDNNKKVNDIIRDIRLFPGFIKGQETRVGFLKKIKKILNENNIDFWLSYGTLIGCMRHNGIIPWDDDIDICMDRKDIHRFFSIKWGNHNIQIERPYEGNVVLHYVKDVNNPNQYNLDLFIVPVGLENDEGGYYRHLEELKKDEIYPIKKLLFEEEEFPVPNNPHDFFKRRYFGMDVLNICSVWNRTVNNLYTKDFNHNKFKIDVKDLDYSLWGSLKNKHYWEDFYKNNEVPLENSSFSSFVDSYILDNKKIESILDIGCGNGRDSEYFSKKYNVAGIDLNPPVRNSSVKYLKKSVIDEIEEKYDVYYMRFIVHSITEIELDILLNNILNKMYDHSLIFIETRSIKGIGEGDKFESNFKSSIGENHFRLHYSIYYLTNKIKNIGFDIIYETEDNNLAIFKDDNPYVIRIICKKIIL